MDFKLANYKGGNNNKIREIKLGGAFIKKVKGRDSFYGWVLALGFLVALLWIYFVRTEPFSDFEYYHRIAAQIAKGGQWGDTYTSVGYSIFLAPFYRLLGSSIWVGKALNLILSTINNLLVLLILKKIGIREALRKQIFVLFVFFPMNIYYNSILASEILFTTLFLLGIYGYLADLKYKYVLLGVITGLDAMVKPFFPLFPLAVFLTDLIWLKKLGKSLQNSVVALLVAGVILAPWLYRNSRLIGEFTYVSNNAGIVLYINNNSQNKVGGWMPAADVENSVVNRPDYLSANPTQKNKMLSHAAKAWIKSHPLSFVGLGFKRLIRTFILPGDIYFAFNGSGLPFLLQIILFAFSELVRAPVFIVGVVSILIHTLFYLYSAVRNGLSNQKKWSTPSAGIDKGSLLLAITFFMFAGVYFITEGQSRYAFPAALSLIFYSVLAIDRVRL